MGGPDGRAWGGPGRPGVGRQAVRLTCQWIPAFWQAAAYCPVQISEAFQKPSLMTVDWMLLIVTATGGLRNAGCPSTVPFDAGVFPDANATAASAALVASSLNALYVVINCNPARIFCRPCWEASRPVSANLATWAFDQPAAWNAAIAELPLL